MITISDIINRSLRRGGQIEVDDTQIIGHCEWCEEELAISSCERSKTIDGIIHRCPKCSDVILVIQRSVERPLDALKQFYQPQGSASQSGEEDMEAIKKNRTAEPKEMLFTLHGWNILSVTDLNVGKLTIPGMPTGSLRKYW